MCITLFTPTACILPQRLRQVSPIGRLAACPIEQVWYICRHVRINGAIVSIDIFNQRFLMTGTGGTKRHHPALRDNPSTVTELHPRR